MRLSKLQHRVLGHLPVWHEDEAWLIQEEGPGLSVRSYSALGLTARLAEDRSMGARTEAQVVVFLKELEKDGYVECTGDQWRMTEAGFKALHEPLLDQHEQTPGPVEIGIGG